MLFNIKTVNYYENFFHETKLFFLNLFKKKELIFFSFSIGFHFYIYSKSNFFVKIVPHV